MKFFRSGPASPSTREAIAGMLSISRSFMADHQNSKSIAARQRRKRVRPLATENDLAEGEVEEEQMAKVHQDDDYGGCVRLYL